MLLNVKNDKGRMLLLQSYPRYVIRDIIVTLLNILHKKCTINCKHRKILMENKKKIQTYMPIAKTDLKLKKPTILYKQKGGFIGALLPIIATVLGGLV